MIGNFITVQQLYDFAVQNNYLKADAYTVLDIINREKTQNFIGNNHKTASLIAPVDNSSTVDFSHLIEYNTEDLIALLST